jgi:FHS family L-fucose permease-like MFS transporter
MKIAGTYQTYLAGETMRVVTPYLVLGGVAVIWCLFLAFSKVPHGRDEVETDTPKGNTKDLLKVPHFYKGVISQFFYCGAQTCTWSFFIPYVQDFTGQPEKVAGYFLTGTLVAFGVGRFLATYLMKFITPTKLMGLYGVINIALVAIGILMPGMIGVWAIFFTSFFMSLMYPTNFALSIRDLGQNTKIAGSIMVMAIVGGAVFPPLMGYIAEATNSMAIAMIIPLVGYVYITYYAYSGSKLKSAL